MGFDFFYNSKQTIHGKVTLQKELRLECVHSDTMTPSVIVKSYWVTSLIHGITKPCGSLSSIGHRSHKQIWKKLFSNIEFWTTVRSTLIVALLKSQILLKFRGSILSFFFLSVMLLCGSVSFLNDYVQNVNLILFFNLTNVMDTL